MDEKTPSKSEETSRLQSGSDPDGAVTGQTPASHPRHRDHQVHLVEQKEVRLTCTKMLHSQPSQRLTVSQALPEMANIGETVEYIAGALRVTDGRACARRVADCGTVAFPVAVGVVVGEDAVVGCRACRCIGVGVWWWCCLQADVVEELVPVHGLVQCLCCFGIMLCCWG